MLTKWGKKIAAILSSNNNSQFLPSAFSNTGSAMIEAKTLDGSVVYIPPVFDTASYTFLSTALVETGGSASTGIAVGSGNTQATETDYSLEHQITGLTVSATPTTQSYYDKTNGKYCAYLDYAISNNTGESVTISEIGLFRRYNTTTTKGNDASTSARRSILIDRTVLSQPITIPNGGAATVRYEFVYDA